MLIQSGGGKVYAVIANDAHYELALMPTLALVSTTVFLTIRCRYKALQSEYFDPMLVPKPVLVGGIERSGNTLRGTVMLNTGFTPDKIGAGFAELVGTKLLDNAKGFLLGTGLAGDIPLDTQHIRSDFLADFGQLVWGAIAPIYPAKDFSGIKPLLTTFDLMLQQEHAGTAKTPLAAIPGGAADLPSGFDQPPVSKLALGDDEPVPPAMIGDAPAPEGVDKGQAPPQAGAKVHILGAHSKTDPAPAPAEPADH